MPEVLYRKYRPSSFGQVVGQEHIIKTLKNSIKKGKVAHAYLFSGPRGTGKTTVARILAKTINCKNPKEDEPCNECNVCAEMNQNKFLDLVEIDAATHTQVDKMRDIIEKINFSPSSGKYKVYIIDEVHMLSKGAFNALLKTLEEPPKHVVFILATTEIHKIPATVISRCQRFDFRRLKVSEITKRLGEIAKKEKAEVEKTVLEFIAINSNGALRDSESLLGQILSMESGKSVTLKEVQEILAITDLPAVVKMARLMLDKKYGEAIEHISKITDDGYDLEQFAKSVIEYSRKLMLIKISPEMRESFLSEMTEEQVAELENISKKASLSKLLRIIRAFIQSKAEIKSSIMPQLPLELAITEINIADEEPMAGSLTNKAAEDYNSKIKEPIKKIADKVSESVKQSHNFIKKSIGLEEKEGVKENKREEISKNSIEIAKSSGIIALDVVRDEWCDILEEIKPRNHSLTAFLKTCQPVGVEGNQIIISCKYSFHKDKLQKAENRLIIEETMENLLKAKVAVKFISQSEAEKLGYKIREIEYKEAKNDLVNSALEIFGGEIV